jgi:phage terminase large subunit-like protein
MPRRRNGSPPASPDPRYMTDAQLEVEARALMAARDAELYRWRCDRPGCDGLPHEGFLHNHARAHQLGPGWLGWLIWLVMTGRGWGKTRTGAEKAREWGEQRPRHIGVIGENATKTKEICFDHPTSGLIAVLPPELIRRGGYHESIGDVRLELTNGTVFRAFSVQNPEAPRGFALDKVWIDEYGAMRPKQAQEILDNCLFALREAADPQILITTTPRPRQQITDLVKEHRKALADAGGVPQDQARPKVAITTGTMRDNVANLAGETVALLENRYAGTRLGRQELSGVLLEDNPGAVWHAWMFDVEGFRQDVAQMPQMARRVVSMDPAASDAEGSDHTGFAVAARDYGSSALFPADPRPRGYVLWAEEMDGLPEARAAKAIELFWRFRCDEMVVEANKGGDWIPAVVRLLDTRVPVRLVHATDNKRTRAQPVSALYSQARVHHVGPPRIFDTLESQMTTWSEETGEDSPDLMDALVWALWALMIEGAPEVQTGKAKDGRLAGRGR